MIFSDNSIKKVLGMNHLWDKLREDIIEALTTSLHGMKRMTQWASRARIYDQKKTTATISMSRDYAP
jgi:hypothetical protein